MPLICQYISPFVLNHRLCRGLFFDGLGQGRRHGASGPWRLQCLQQKLIAKLSLIATSRSSQQLTSVRHEEKYLEQGVT